MLSAKDGKITNTVAKSSLMRVWLSLVSGVSGPVAVRTMQIPIIPKAIDE